MDLGRLKKRLEEGLGAVGSFIGSIFNPTRTVQNINQGIRNVINLPAPTQQTGIRQAGPSPAPSFQSNLPTFAPPSTAIQSTFKSPVQTPSLPTDPLKAIQTVRTEAPKATVQPKFDFNKEIGAPVGKAVSDFFAYTNPLAPGIAVYTGIKNAITRTPENTAQELDRNLDFTRGFNPVRIGSGIVSSIPSTAAATETAAANIYNPIYRGILGEQKANEIFQRRQQNIRDLYGASRTISDFGENTANFRDPNSIQAQAGKTAADITAQIGLGALTGGASVPVFMQQAQGRVSRDIYEQTGDVNKAAAAGAAYAPVEAALEKTGVSKVLRPGRSIAGAAVKGYISEGSTEAAQQVAENLTKMAAGDTTVTSPFQGVAESAIIGGAVGSPINVATTVANRNVPQIPQNQQTVTMPGQVTPSTQTITPTPTATQTPAQVQMDTQTQPQSVEESAQMLQQQIEAVQNRYSQENFLRKKERQFVDPFALAARIDRARAKQLNVKTLPKSESLEAKLDIAIGNPNLTIAQRLKDFEVDKLIQKYPEGTQTGEAFNTYRILKFAQELYNKRKINIMPSPDGTQMPIESINQQIADYEARNPDAIADNKKIKKLYDNTLQRAEDAGLLEPGSAKYISSLYDNYASIDRVLPENLISPEVGISPIGTLSRQTIVQNIEGSNAPIDTSWNATLERLRTAERQMARNAAGNVYRQAVEAGVTVGKKEIGTVKQSREQVLALRDLRNSLTELRNINQKLTTQRGRVTANVRTEKIKLNEAQNRLVKQVRTKLRQTVQDPDAIPAIKDLSVNDIVEISQNMFEYGVSRNARSFAKRSRNHAALLGELQSIRETLADNRQIAAQMQTQIADISPSSTTGLQMVTVLDKGVPVRIETTPEVANLLQRMDEKKLDAVTRFASYITRPFRIAFTGWANPVFSVTSFAAYDAPMGVINSPNGWKTIYSPSAIAQSIKSFSSNSQFQRELARSGAQLATGSLMGNELAIDAKYIASRKNTFTKLKYAINPRNIKNTINSLDILGGKLANVTRTRIAKVAYDTAINRGMSPDAAIAEAVYAYNNIMPNYQRTTSTLRQIDAFLPYTAASVAGTRSFGKAARKSPIQTLAKVGVFLAPMATVVATSFANSDEAEEFYKDMVNANKTYVLDSNMIIVTEGASKNDKTGEWEGVIKIPVSPELRNLNGVVWRQMYDNITGNNLATPKTYASALFNTMTGGIFQFVNNPAASTVIGLATNKDARGIDVVPEDLRYLPTQEQYTKNTTEISKQIAGAIGVAPAKVQYVFDQFGLSGRLASGKSEIFEEIKDRFVGAKGVSAGAQFYRDLEADKKSIAGWNENDEKAYGSLHPRKKDSRGIDIWNDEVNIYNPVARLEIYNRYPKVLELDKKQNQRNISQGKPGNPLFELENWQLKKVLEKEALPPGTKDPELDKLFQQEWYADYRNDKKIFYEKLRELAQKEGWEFSQSDNPYPQTPPQLQAAMDQYNRLPKGTGDRSRWIRNNPGAFDAMKSQWAAIDDWQNRQRAKRGLAATEGQAGIDAGFKEAFAAGGTGTRRTYARRGYTPRVNIPRITSRFQKPSGQVRQYSPGGIRQLRPAQVVVKRERA